MKRRQPNLRQLEIPGSNRVISSLTIRRPAFDARGVQFLFVAPFGIRSFKNSGNRDAEERRTRVRVLECIFSGILIGRTKRRQRGRNDLRRSLHSLNTFVPKFGF